MLRIGNGTAHPVHKKIAGKIGYPVEVASVYGDRRISVECKQHLNTAIETAKEGSPVGQCFITKI